jgi:hypothetical protein
MGLFSKKKDKKSKKDLLSKVGDKIDDLAENLEDAVEEAGEKIEDALEESPEYLTHREKIRKEGERIEAINEAHRRKEQEASEATCPYCSGQLNQEGHCENCGGV